MHKLGQGRTLVGMALHLTDPSLPATTRGDRLRMARERMPGAPDRISFADALGVSRNTVARYEKWTYGGQNKAIVKLWALETGVPYEWLWGESDDGHTVTQRYRATLKAA